MTALEFMTTFRHVEVVAIGRQDTVGAVVAPLFWAIVIADSDGTEPDRLFVMEHAGRVYTLQNLGAREEIVIRENPVLGWKHERAIEETGS